MSETIQTTETVTLADLLATATPGPKRATLLATHKAGWTVTRIDRLAGGRGLTVKAVVTNPKKPGTAADRNWPLYTSGLTVGAFIDAYPTEDGGKARARTSLAWDLNYGYVTIVNADGETVSV